MKNKIFFKLVAAFGAVMLLFSIILGSVFILLFRNHTININRTAMEEKAVSIASTLSSFQVGGLAGSGQGGYGAYIKFLDELAMAEVWIVDEQLNISTRGHRSYTPNYTELPENAEEIVSKVFSGEMTYGAEFSGLLGIGALTVGAPIWIGEKVVGAVLIHSPVSGITEAVKQGSATVLVGCVIALLFSGIIAAFLSYRFTRPLSQMKNAALALAEGNYEVQTSAASGDEIGQLAKVLDTLAQRLRTAELEQENLDKLRESFVVNVSHELRTPVAVLRGSIELLREGTVTSPAETIEYYDQMLSESRHLERLVNDLLELSRLQDMGFQLSMEKVNLCDVVNDAVRAVRRVAQSKQVAIEIALPDTECLISGDYGRIRQLLFILLDNAVKFSYEKGTIEVTLIRQNGFMLTVTDHGIGIDQEDIPYIFDRFHKTNTKENKSGTGLGLAIAGEIVKRHHATISVQSNEGGTSFRLIFP